MEVGAERLLRVEDNDECLKKSLGMKVGVFSMNRRQSGQSTQWKFEGLPRPKEGLMRREPSARGQISNQLFSSYGKFRTRGLSCEAGTIRRQVDLSA